MVTETITHLCSGALFKHIIRPGTGTTPAAVCSFGVKISAHAMFASHAVDIPILAAYRERLSMRAIERILGVSHHIPAKWLKEKSAPNHR